MSVFDGSLRIRTLCLEDLVGMKVLALANDPGRERRDLADIELLAERFVDVDDYIAFATTVARLSNHACRPFRPIRGSNFKL